MPLGAGNMVRLLDAVSRLPADGAAVALRDLRAAALADPDQDMDAVIAARLTPSGGE